jgi:glutaredoxin 3
MNLCGRLVRESPVKRRGLRDGWKMQPPATIVCQSPPEFPAMPEAPVITIYSSGFCPYCVAAKNFLKSRGQSWTELRIDTDPANRAAMAARTSRTSVPQIFIGDVHVGGFEDMVALDRQGGLAPLLGEQAR